MRNRLGLASSVLSTFSLRVKLVAVIVTLLTVVSAALIFFYTGRMNRLSQQSIEERASGMSTVLQSAVAAGLDFDDAASVTTALGALDTAPDVLYAVVRRQNGSVLASWVHKDSGLQVKDLPQVAPGTISVVGTAMHKAVELSTAAGAHGVLDLGFSLETVQKQKQNNLMMSLAIFASVLLVGLLLAWSIGSVMGTPLRQMTELSLLIAEGDIAAAEKSLGGTERVQRLADGAGGEADDKDEVALLRGSFARMLLALRESSTTLKESAKLLASSIEELTNSAEQQSQTVSSQATALHETQTTAQEIKQTSQMAAEKAAAVLEVAERAQTIGKTGEAAIAQSVEGLNEIRRHSQEISRTIYSLAEQMQQIGRITETVKDLADQSNMLALNAAIEAVRSGEHGRSFAVVAREIRGLADQSLQATGRVREILEQIGTSIRSAVAITDHGEKQMESEASRVKSSGATLSELSRIVSENSSAARQIAASVSQQNAGIMQIFTAMSDLNRMMDDNVRRLASTNEAIAVVKDVSGRVLDVAKRYRI